MSFYNQGFKDYSFGGPWHGQCEALSVLQYSWGERGQNVLRIPWDALGETIL